MIDSKFEWQLDQVTDPERVQTLAEALGVSPLIAAILVERGFETEASAQHFLTPSAADFHDPLLMHDMQKGIDRIQQAITNNEKITVYGDYDADGITSTTIMYETLTDLGANVSYYIPNRFSDGYGPNKQAFKKIIENGTTLLITVDNGVAGNQAIDFANSLNCDVIVTDHHSLPEKLPNALAIIHPRVKGDGDRAYPFGELSGAGVALKVAQGLMDELPVDLIDLAAIGTVADVVSLRDENRAIVKFGLTAIQNTQRPGLMALIKAADINLDKFDEQDIGFGIAPRLNSLGRLDDATVGVELLSTFDEDRATELANFANQQNDSRKSLVNQFYTQAVQMIESSSDLKSHMTLVVVGNNWHQGVLGIVASKLVEKYGRPTLVLTSQKETDELKGSGRSIDAFDLFAAIDPIRDQTIGFGGHHSAVGLTILADKVEQLRQQLEQAAVDQKLDLSNKTKLEVSASVPVSKINADLLEQLKVLAPFGEDNPKPVFQVNYDQLRDVRTMGKGKEHLQLTLTQKGQQLRAVAFGAGVLAGQLLGNSTGLKIVGQLNENTWHNQTTIQLMVDDFNQDLPPVVDQRTQQLHKQMFSQPGTYVFFHKRLMTQLVGYIENGSSAVMYDQLEKPESLKQVYIVDCPDVVDDLEQVLQTIHPKTTVLYLYKKQPILKLGMPDRPSYAKLFRFVKNNPNLNIATQLRQLSKHLHIASRTIIFMIQVFLELDFITIHDKIINLSPDYQAKDLKSAPSYHLRQEQLKAEKQLLVSDTNELVSFVEKYLDN